MLNAGGALTEEAKKLLTEEEISMFNALPRENASWWQQRQAVASRLISAAIQRKALLEVEKRGRITTWLSIAIAGLSLLAFIVQTLSK